MFSKEMAIAEQIVKKEIDLTDPGYRSKKFLNMAKENKPLVLLGILAGVSGVVFRFAIKSPLWLDEALTVNIAHLPISEIPAALKRDGAPPLYYFLLHYWMLIFGSSDIATRSLSALFGLLCIPFVYLGAKLMWGKKAGYIAATLYSVSPFSIEYSTSVRMYSLVMLEAAIGIYLVLKCLQKVTLLRLIFVSATTAGLLYTHYWALFFTFCAGGFLLALAVYKKSAKLLLVPVAVGIGCLSFLWWLPIFLFQLKHTGTPWSEPPSMTAVVNVVTQFAGGDTLFGRALAMIFFLLLLLALFGVPSEDFQVILNFKTVKRVRFLAAFFGVTLLTSVGAAVISKTAYSSRYASILLVPIILLVASGFLAIKNSKLVLILLSICVVLGVWGGFYNFSYMRTQAGVVASKINTLAKAGDVVAYCPDQLGPAVNRLVKPGLFQVTFPAWQSPGPKFVDWIDYAKRNESASVSSFVKKLFNTAKGHSIFYVWQGGYLTFGDDCQAIASLLSSLPNYKVINLVGDNPLKYYEPSNLTMFSTRLG
jgi:mannosyltransferase